MDLEQHLKRQMAFSRATFGPGPRTEGVVDHIRKELVEIIESGGHPSEWVDVVILGLDGLWRSTAANGEKPERVAAACVEEILAKQQQNELRDWPDWRTAAPGKAIEHVRPGPPPIQYPVSPRLLPEGGAYTCDYCGRTWEAGTPSGCEPCNAAIDARNAELAKGDPRSPGAA